LSVPARFYTLAFAYVPDREAEVEMAEDEAPAEVPVAPTGPPPKTFEVVTTAQTERRFIVQAKDEEQAKARWKVHNKDSETLREGIVVEADEQIDTTPRQIREVHPYPRPQQPSAPTTPRSRKK
jgi:hypothetical protein